MESYENNFRKNYETSDKYRKLNTAKQEVERIIDKRGMGIDDGIKETVSILRAMNLPTSSSCAGHTEKERYSPPYIEIYSKAPEGWKVDKEKQALWKEENLKHKAYLQLLLNRFYNNRDVSGDVRLHLANMGMFGGFRLETVGTNMKKGELGIKIQEDIFKKIKLYQMEIKAFSDFIKEIYLKSSK